MNDIGLALRVQTNRSSWADRGAIHVLLRREGGSVNVKRVHRMYRMEGLNLRTKRARRHVRAVRRVERPLASPPKIWAIVFVSDSLFDGKRIRALTVVDAYIRLTLKPDGLELRLRTQGLGHVVRELGTIGDGLLRAA